MKLALCNLSNSSARRVQKTNKNNQNLGITFLPIGCHLITFDVQEKKKKKLCEANDVFCLFLSSCHTRRLASSGASSASLQEFTLLAAARRSAAAAAAVAAAGVGGGGSGGSHPMSMGVGMPSSGVGPGELHPAYRLNPYTIEHLYSSLHSSPTASLRGLSPLDPRGNKNLALFFFFFSVTPRLSFN